MILEIMTDSQWLEVIKAAKLPEDLEDLAFMAIASHLNAGVTTPPQIPPGDFIFARLTQAIETVVVDGRPFEFFTEGVKLKLRPKN